MQQNGSGDGATRSAIAQLRDLVPLGLLSYSRARVLAERLARALLELRQIDRVPVPIAIVGGLPKIQIRTDRDLPTSGASFWDSSNATWVITVNGWEPTTRQRFTVLHEFFHIVVHRHVERAGIFRRLSRVQIEAVADYFAGCVLVPESELTDAVHSGLLSAGRLARRFGVSTRAIEVRLDQLHLSGLGSEFADSSDHPEAMA